MNIIEKIVLNEPLDDIVTVFALIKAPPHLDMMISCYKPESIRHGELQRSYAKLFHEGVLVEGEKGLAARGPNWKAPSFVTEKSYD